MSVLNELQCDTYQHLRAAARADLHSCESQSRAHLNRRQLDLLNAELGVAFTSSPYYRQQRYQWGLPESVTSLDDLARFPLTTKDDLRDQYPFGFCAVSLENLIRYGESTGTTGRPTSSYVSYSDWIRGNVWVEESLRAYFSSSDLAFIAIPYELTFASYDLDRAIEQIGSTVVAVGTLNQICPFPRLVEMMHVLHPTALVCTPSRALRLYDMLKQKGFDPLQVGLQKILYVGETCSPARLKKLAELWQCQLLSAYGSTETNSLALPCRNGAMHLMESRFLFEVVDPQTTTRVSDGQRGELLLTTLQSEAMPLLRYRTGDLVRLDSTPCACGSPRRIIHHLGRLIDSIHLGTQTINKLELEEVVMATPGTGHYLASGERAGQLQIFVETVGSQERVCQAVADAVEQAFKLPARVQALPRELVTRAMDGKLKPGSLELEDLELAGRAQQ